MTQDARLLLIERLQAIGFTVERMDFADTQNFWAWRGQGETLAFAGHTDVVRLRRRIVGLIRRLNPPFVMACYSGAVRRRI
ncbi:hypothetical protein ACVXHA_15030 [Escherichia coli]